MAGLSFALVSKLSQSTRVAVFLDYQNSWHRTRELFGSPAAPPTMGHVHPDRLGALLCRLGQRVDPDRQLSEVRVYRGLPGLQSHRKLRLAFDRQTARWAALERVSVHTRPMRYSPAERYGTTISTLTTLMPCVTTPTTWRRPERRRTLPVDAVESARRLSLIPTMLERGKKRQVVLKSS